MQKFEVSYSSNNSGGDWWLTDDDWLCLEDAGWEVQWVKDSDTHRGDRFISALAMSASKEFEAESQSDAVEAAEVDFEVITGQSPFETGCQCCGPPHNFY